MGVEAGANGRTRVRSFIFDCIFRPACRALRVDKNPPTFESSKEGGAPELECAVNG